MSFGYGEESYEEPINWLNDCDRVFRPIYLAISQACTTLLILLNTQRIYGQHWIEFWESTMRILLAMWRVPLAPQ